MSLNNKEQKCVACSAYLFEEDDIVYCPVCGAPHHRDCYTAVGHCALEALHGTENEYKKPEAGEQTEPKAEENTEPTDNSDITCRTCGSKLAAGSQFCSHCGSAVNGAPFSAFSPFTQMVEIKDDTLIAEGVTAVEAAKVVRVNPFRYIPKFLGLGEKKKASWNWAAFILPGAWFAYRKMYKESIISTALMIMTMLFNIPFNMAIMQLPTAPENISNYLQLGEYYAGHMSEIGMLPLILALAGMVISLIIRIVCGIYGDWFYRGRVIESVGIIKAAEDREAAENKYSGISFIGFTLAVCAMEFLPSIITVFIS